MRLIVPYLLVVMAGCGATAPAGYRMDDYNSVVTAALPDTITVLDTLGAHALWSSHTAVFVDVLPQPPKPDLPLGTLWRERGHDTIPGSLWLPDVGYGALPDLMDTYFRVHLELATKRNLNAPVVFFCRSDCWMSWNAAKRAAEEYGYRSVYWYPDGTDGWRKGQYSMVRAERAPLIVPSANLELHRAH